MTGHEFQKIRHKLGKSQQQMASAVGVAVRTISRWESRDLPVPQETVERLQTLHLDDHRSLVRVSSQRLIEELATRAALWDAAGITTQHSKS